MRRLLIGIVLLTVIVTVGYVASRSEEPPTRLHVSVTGLPKGTEARVTVKRSEGQGTHSFTGTDTRKVSAGDYTLKIAEVTAGGRRYLPADATIPVHVRSGQETNVVAAYRIALRTNAEVAPSENNPILHVDERSVSLRSGSYAMTLKPGKIIVSGATRTVPSAFAAVVEKITTAKGTAIVQVRHVPMSVAMPKMVIRTTQDRGKRPFARHAAYQAGPGSEAWLEYDVSKHCTVGSPKIKANFEDFDSGLESDIDFHWDPGSVTGKSWPPGVHIELPHPELKVKLQPWVSGAYQSSLEAPGEFACKTGPELPRVSLDKACKAAAKLLGVGLLSPECDLGWKQEISAKATAGVNVGAKVGAKIQLGGEFNLGGDITPDLRPTRPVKPRVEETWLNGGKKSKGLEITGEIKNGVQKVIGIGIGVTEATRIGIGYSEWMPFGMKVTPHTDKHQYKAEGIIDHELSLKVTVPAVKDPQVKFNILPVKFPLFTLTLGGSDDRRHPVPQAPEGASGRVDGPRRLPDNLRLPYETEAVDGSKDASAPLFAGYDADQSSYYEIHTRDAPYFDPCLEQKETKVQDVRHAYRRIENGDPTLSEGAIDAHQFLMAFRNESAAKDYIDDLIEDSRKCQGGGNEVTQHWDVVKEAFRIPPAGLNGDGFGARVENSLGTRGYYQAARLGNTVLFTIVQGEGELTDIGAGPRKDVSETAERFLARLCTRREWEC